jgi:RNA polymerase sigma-70 factor (ECF subfamily)
MGKTNPVARKLMQQPADDLQADARLMDRAAREPQAFAVIYERFYPMILNYTFRRTLSISAAEELTSNTFFKALRALPKYRAGGQPIRAWLYAIATNELRMHWRWRRRHPVRRLGELDAARHRVLFEQGGLEQQAGWEQRMEDFAQLHQALATLPQRHQTIIALRYFEDLTLEQIAQVVNKPLGSVKSWLHRATAKLRTAAAERLPADAMELARITS